MKWGFLSVCACFAMVYGFTAEPEVAKLTLNATGKINRPADELQMKIGVITLQETAEDALEENSEKMRAIMESLEDLGLVEEDYETSHFSINPTYSPYPKNPPLGWKPSIVGYEVKNTLQIHTQKLDLIGRVIDAANEEGANAITDLHFGVRSPRNYWKEAITAAATNAVSDARAIALATGVELVRVLSLSLNQTYVRSPQLNVASFAKEGACGDAAPPIEIGEVTIEASVSIVYEIR